MWAPLTTHTYTIRRILPEYGTKWGAGNAVVQRQRLIQVKIQNAKERARELGAGKRQAKGADAEGGSAAQQQNDDGDEDEGEEGWEGYDDDNEEEAYGEDGAGAGPEPGGHTGLAALLDPRAAAARRQGSLGAPAGSSGVAAAAGEEDAGLESGLYYGSGGSGSEEAGEDADAGHGGGAARTQGQWQIPTRFGRPDAG